METIVVPFELSDKVLGQDLSKALSSDAVVRMCVENSEYSSIDLQHCHTQGCPTKFVHENVAVKRGQINLRRK